MEIRYFFALGWVLILVISMVHLELVYNKIAKLKPEIYKLEGSKQQVITEAMKFNNELALSVSEVNRSIYKVLFWSRRAVLGIFIILVAVNLNLVGN
ncbi:MAG: hypothetical protein ACTH4U_13980 [Pseudoalteromonas prydzensis]|uniref:Uncharacterized protein n=1 Tax=Pseudoalteromonas prydzensis TaxID=182141 RepID=A0A7V1GD58_9GAMM|nr:hypothetical protein [Pseudoalteromonas prydzensis]HEA15323.1 hypothetical protein [Pseudoalteromonas prydzensis]